MDSQTAFPDAPVVGIVGSAGAYGRWLRGFFERRMGLAVLGHDPADPASVSPDALLDRADVLLFAAPIRATGALIDDYVARSAGREAGRLWLDVTSIKQAPVAAMLRSRAEVVGLHPMTAPPKAPTLKGRVVVVCEARLSRWRPWLARLLDALEGECVEATPERHDQVMALVQAMVHASHLAQAGVLREYAGALGAPAGLMPFRSASFELDAAIAARILSLNPAIYEDIQFGNPHAGEVLDHLLAQLGELRALVRAGDDDARARFRAAFLRNREAFGAPALADGNYAYERVGYLLADLAGKRYASVHLPEDRSGSLRALLHVFERHGVSLESIHSSRTPEGEVHFRIGFDREVDAAALDAAVVEIDASGIGRVLARG
ncbi:MAG: prephenate dehydrogenase [Proteobacteria bacterium]|nr:prephenate dehydrogenase [Pseudomonadota bacterium]